MAITIRTWILIAIIILSFPTSSLDLVGLAAGAAGAAGTGDRYTHKEMVISSHALDVALTMVLTLFNVWVWCKAWSVTIHLYYLQVLTVTV